MLQIVKASAGSGKTYKITLEFLRLVFRNPENYRHILLTTFTNKATAEMKHRIIQALYGFAQGESNEFSKEICEKNNISKEEAQKIARKILSSIISDYGRFSVTTIDSLFQRILREFAREVKLPGAYEIEMDSGKVMEEVIDLLIEKIEQGSTLLKWMIEFSEEKIALGKDYKIQNELKRISKKLLNEEFQRIESNLVKVTEDKDLMLKIQQEIIQKHELYKRQAVEISEEIKSILSAYNLQYEDFKSKFFVKMEKVLDGEFGSPTATMINNIDNPDNWVTKGTSRREDIMKVYPKINELLKQYIQVVYPKIIVYKLFRDNIYIFGIISDIVKELSEYRKNNNLLLISDAQNLLRQVIGENETPFVYEKIGNIYKHFMLDEFQDTSAMQWENFKPLIANSVAEGKLSFVVGDVKQSIYRFRGGDWRLLLHKIKQDINPYKETSLSGNWRSLENIVGFNNCFFKSIPSMMKIFDIEIDPNSPYANVFSDVFSDGAQDIPENRAGGYVRFEKIDTRENVLYKNIALDKMFEQITKLILQGHKPKSICILVRNNSHAKEIIAFAHSLSLSNPDFKALDLRFLSPESLYIYSNPAVVLLVQSIRFLNEKGEDLLYAAIVEAFELLHNKEFSPISVENWFEELPDLLKNEKDNLRKLDIVQLVEKLCSYYEIDKYQQHTAYLQTFLDAIHLYVEENGNNHHLFGEWWDDNKEKFSIQTPSSVDAVKIMTMHKSKGLEFEFVFVPFYSFTNIGHNDSNFVWIQPNELAEFGIENYPIKLSKSLTETEYSTYFQDNKIMSILDDINLMYVTFTRAKRGLFVWYQHYESNGESFSEAKLIHYFLQNNTNIELPEYFSSEGKVKGLIRKEYLEQNKEEESTIYSFGKIPEIDLEKSEELKPLVINRLGFSTDFVDIKTFVKRQRKSSELTKGSELHEFLAQIKTNDDLAKGVCYFQKHYPISKETMEVWIQKLKILFTSEESKNWFNGTYEVYNERPLNILETGETIIPDKLLIKEHEAVIVDYKTGKAYKDVYDKQVKKYVSAVQKLGFNQVSAYLVYWDEMKIDKVF